MIHIIAFILRFKYRALVLLMLAAVIYQGYELREGQRAIWELIETKFITV